MEVPENDDSSLTPREQEVLRLKLQGHTDRKIADLLSIDETTVKKHVHHILQKLPQYRRWSKGR